MFSLIITLIAIALVAALALATLYYGGPVFNEGAERALAAQADSHAQQIMGALEMYRAETGSYPNSLNDLVTANYLKALPTAQLQVEGLTSAIAATGTYTLVSPGQPVIVLKPVSLATCQAFNKVNIGAAGVLKAAHTGKLKQCIGSDVNNLMIVTAKSAADLLFVSTDPAAVVQIGAVVTSAIPDATSTDTSADGWLVPPAVANPVVYLDGGGAPLSSLNFADTSVGSTSAPVVVTVKNTASTGLTFNGTGPVISAPFAVTATTCTSATLAPNATCSVSLTFAPTAVQAYAGASYALALQGVNTSLASLPLTGTGLAVASASVAFVADSFTDTDGILVHAHAPDIGGTWIRPYDLAYAYAYDDNNFAIVDNKLQYADWTGWGSDRIVLNQAVPPSSDYDVSMQITTANTSGVGYVELMLLGRAFLPEGAVPGVVPGLADALMGFLYLDGTGGSYCSVDAISNGNSPSMSLPGISLSDGTHTFRMRLEGTTLTLFWDDTQIYQRVVTSPWASEYGVGDAGAPGMVGFSLHHVLNMEDVRLDNFRASR